MPPKAKYTREEIVQTALELVSERGICSLNARNLGAALGTSTRPLFTAFKNMGELSEEVYAAAMKRFEEYASQPDKYNLPFKNVGMQMILFASEQPNLFQLLFMSGKQIPQDVQPFLGVKDRPAAGSFDDMLGRLGVTRTRCMEYIKRDYGLAEREASLLFRSLWLFTYGISTLIANGVCCYNENEVSEMLSAEFRAVMGLIRSGNAFLTESVQKGTGNTAGSVIQSM
ncbi:MAG: TetR/AcrR family transcriptional regulator [Oscillospiraceae bacterium]|nr:TetR/AcrR family transcriptional regulator [Oscillospiraceae bacterium]